MPDAQDDTPRRYFEVLGNFIANTVATDGAGRVLDLDDAITTCVAMVAAVRAGRKTVFCVGNGGSAAIVSHVSNDLCKAVGVRSQSLTEVSLLTAFANDEGYEKVYSQPLSLFAQAGDLLFAISSSGKSPNILQAVAAFQRQAGAIVTLSGFDPANPLRRTGDVNFYVPATKYGFVEMAHASLLHCITDFATKRA